MIERIEHYAAAGYGAVAVETVEEERVAQAVREMHDWSRVVEVSATGVRIDGEPSEPGFPKAFAEAARVPGTLLVVRDYQHICPNGPAYRGLRDALPGLRSGGSFGLLLAPSWRAMPAELVREIPVVGWPLPDRETLRRAVAVVAEAAQLTEPEGEGERALLDAAAGLTLGEAEGAFALAVSETGRLSVEVVQREKLRTLQADGSLQVWPIALAQSFGGYGELRAYITDEIVPSLADRELAVRGLLLVGVPGTGKSLAARMLGELLAWPVVRWDIGASKGSLVGETERRCREARARAEAVSPCVLVVDEIEKAIGGYASSARSDSGVTLGIVGDLLTWLQEHRSPILTVLTCNDYSGLPPELTRPGRIDAQFFLDLPSDSERAEIAGIHLRRYVGETETAELTASIVEHTRDWTGAEIEGLVRSAARRTHRVITPAALREAARHIRPIARTRAEEIRALRDWAQGALRPASRRETVTVEAPGTRAVRRVTQSN